jgi:hypothetical protein
VLSDIPSWNRAWKLAHKGKEIELCDGGESCLVVPIGSESKQNSQLAPLTTWLNAQGSDGCLMWDLLAYNKETALGYKPDGVGYNNTQSRHSLMAHYAYFELKVGPLAASAKGIMVLGSITPVFCLTLDTFW